MTRPGIVHRLDMDTSGVMVVAKELEAQAKLAAQFAEHSIGRRYRAFCKGIPKKRRIRLSTPHGRDPKDRRRFAAIKGATRRAVSIFELQSDFGEASELAVRLETGRTHQIRMHARFLGCPILGDALYGSRPRHEELKQACAELSRQALHAELLSFDHPHTGERCEFAADLPPDLESLRSRLAAMSTA
jgi:23S rRNA pseudouridine1911/1915/1917 synthase